MFNLSAELPRHLPRAILWAQAQAEDIRSRGVTLNEVGIATARRVGVKHPEHVRVLVLDTFPVPDDPELQLAAIQTGLLGPNTAGLTLGYGILIARHCTARLLARECRHVHQYEQTGSITAFLPLYLNQIAEFGYERAPYEVDARAWESDAL